MVVLVTGANGFLGSYICRQLIDDSHDVIALIRDNSDTTRIDDIIEHVEVRRADLLDFPQLVSVFANVDTVIHCAAQISFDRKDCDRMIENNVEGTRNVVNLCIEHNVSQLIHISSIAALGRSKREETLSENTKWSDSPFNTCYGKSKYLSELEVWRGKGEGLLCTVINPSIIVGRMTLGEGSSKIFDYVKSGRKYYPTGNINVVDVRDVVEVVTKALDKTGSGKRFILNGATLPYKKLFEKIAKNLNVPPPNIATSGWKLNLALFFDYLRAKLTRSPRFMSREIVRNSSSKIEYASTLAQETFNTTYHSLDDTLKWITSEPQ